MEFIRTDYKITDKQLLIIEEKCLLYKMPKKVNIRASAAGNIVVYDKKDKILLVLTPTGDIITKNKDLPDNDKFSSGMIEVFNKRLGEKVKEFFNLEFIISKDCETLQIQAKPKVDFLKPETWNFRSLNIIPAKIFSLENKEEIIELIEKEDLSTEIDYTYFTKEEIALMSPTSVYLKVDDKKTLILINNLEFPYEAFFTQKNALRKRLNKITDDLKIKIKKYPNFIEAKEYCESKNIGFSYLNKKITSAAIKYKKNKLTIDFSKPFKKIVDNFIFTVNEKEKIQAEALAQEFSKCKVFGKIVGVAACQILLDGVNGTEASIIKLLRGLSISHEMYRFSNDKLRDNPYIDKFNDLTSDYISNIIRSLLSSGIISEKRMRGTYGTFYSLRKNDKTEAFVNYTLTHDFDENEFTIIKKLLKEKNPIPILIEHPTCYFYSKEVQKKIAKSDEKTKKMVETLYKIEDDKTIKKMLKDIKQQIIYAQKN